LSVLPVLNKSQTQWSFRLYRHFMSPVPRASLAFAFISTKQSHTYRALTRAIECAIECAIKRAIECAMPFASCKMPYLGRVLHLAKFVRKMNSLASCLILDLVPILRTCKFFLFAFLKNFRKVNFQISCCTMLNSLKIIKFAFCNK
jgi:hypothetical protein